MPVTIAFNYSVVQNTQYLGDCHLSSFILSHRAGISMLLVA